jgi:hypothetical protein
LLIFFPHYWLLAHQPDFTWCHLDLLANSVLTAKSSYWDGFYTQQTVILYIVIFFVLHVAWGISLSLIPVHNSSAGVLFCQWPYLH